MARAFYPPPHSAIEASGPPIERHVARVPFLPLLPPPPSTSALPSLPPFNPSSPSPIPGYRHTTHILPCAYPRTFHHSTSPPASQKPRDIWKIVDPTSESKLERSKRLRNESFELARRQEDLEHVKDGERVGERLEQVVERFVKEDIGGRRVEGKKEVTLIFGNANGLPVEDWELPLRIATAELSSGAYPFKIVEIWFLNTPLVHPNHGTAYSWADHARDLTSFILHYLPVNPFFSSNLPSELERRDAPSQRDGIVTVGHSFSGNAFLLAELEKGRDGGKALAEGVILFDPMILDPRSQYAQKSASTPEKPSVVVTGAVGRADTWPSLAAVKPALLRSPFFQRFDPVQLDSYVRHGFVRINPADSSDERVTLAFPRWAEGLVFGRGDAIKETWDRLEFGEKVGKGCKEVRFVFPEEFGMTGHSSDSRRLAHLLASSPTPTNPHPTRVSNVIVEQAGHLIIQENPTAVSEVLLQFMFDLFAPLLAKL